MTAFIRLFFPSYEPLATVENAGATSVLAPEVEDAEAYDQWHEDVLERGFNSLMAQTDA